MGGMEARRRYSIFSPAIAGFEGTCGCTAAVVDGIRVVAARGYHSLGQSPSLAKVFAGV